VRWRRALRGIEPPDVVLLSGAPAAVVVPHLPWAGVPVVAHVHELAGLLADLAPGVRADLLGVDLLLAAGPAVAQVLVHGHGVSPERVRVHPEVLEPGRPPLLAGPAGEDPALALGIPPGTPVVLGAGSRRRRKGVDLFVQLGVALRRLAGAQAPHLVWVGADDPDAELWPPELDVRSAGLAGRVHLVDEVDDLGPWLRRADVLALTSREDASPLVCLEAAWWRTPFVAFDCGGAAPLAGEDRRAGVVVPPLDVEALAAEVVALLADPDRAAAIGAAARRRVEAEHLVSAVAPRVWADLEGVVAG
jgi:glycosyltransferase involved in cell wall biosynthesis